MIPSMIPGGAYVCEGQGSLEPSDDWLDDRIINHDRIINLKFFREKSERSFTIRNDYEPVFHNDGGEGSVSFKTCVEKPDIKIAYKQVAESVAIEIDIEIVNFSIGDAEQESTQSMDSTEGDPVTQCVIQMGYRAQFPDWTKLGPNADIKQFWDLKHDSLKGKEIVAQILTGYSESYPPDRKTVFKGIIGTMEDGLRWEHDVKDLIKGYNDPEISNDLSELEEALLQSVTRRFIRSSVIHKVTLSKSSTNKEDLSGNAEKKFMQEACVYKDGKWETLKLVDGILSISDAKEYGVLCYLSETLRIRESNKLYGYDLAEEEAGVLNAIPPTPFNDLQNLIGGQLRTLQQHYPFLRWYLLPDGNFFFYHEKDKDKDIWSDSFVKELQKTPVPLPAIYDMTPAGTRVIRCPFISFIGSMSTVLFQSRYSIGTLTSYYYPVKTNAFLVILAKIDFATVQDINQMELTCVDCEAEEVTVDEASGEIKVRDRGKAAETPEAAKVPEDKSRRWFERVLTVVPAAPGPLGVLASWGSVIKDKVHVEPGRWPEDGLPGEKEKLEALIEWNSKDGRFQGWLARNDSKKYGKSIENDDIERRLGITVPWLCPGDKIIVRHPFQPEYPPDQEIK